MEIILKALSKINENCINRFRFLVLKLTKVKH